MWYNSRRGSKKKPNIVISGEVEAEECYVVAGHKGQHHNVVKAGRKPRRRRLKGKRGRATSADDKNPVFGMVQRGGLVRLKVLPNVQQITIQPIIESTVEKGATFYTDEYNIYNKVTSWGYEHKTVNHGEGQYARNEDGNGKYEVHCNTQEGILVANEVVAKTPHRSKSRKITFLYGIF